MYVMFAVDYAGFIKGKTYRVNQEGYDWVRIRRDGRSFFIHRNYLEDDPISRVYEMNEEEEETYEDFINF